MKISNYNKKRFRSNKEWLPEYKRHWSRRWSRDASTQPTFCAENDKKILIFNCCSENIRGSVNFELCGEKFHMEQVKLRLFRLFFKAILCLQNVF